MASAPYWSIYARVFQDHASIGRRTPSRDIRGRCDAICRELKKAALIYLPTEQVDAVPRLGPTFAEEASGTAYLRAPFDTTFLAVGAVYDDLETGWASTSLYAALLRQVEDRLLVIPFFLPAQSLTNRPTTLALGEAYADAAEGKFAATIWREGSRQIEDGQFSGSLREELFERASGGAARALRALFLLESVNVRLREGKPAGPGHRGNGVPSYEVVIREPTRSEHDPSAQTVDWSHRWEVRGHFKHFRRGPVYEANPDRRIEIAGDSYVRIWSPPYIKGPADKPLIPKVHIYAGGRMGVATER